MRHDAGTELSVLLLCFCVPADAWQHVSWFALVCVVAWLIAGWYERLLHSYEPVLVALRMSSAQLRIKHACYETCSANGVARARCKSHHTATCTYTANASVQDMQSQPAQSCIWVKQAVLIERRLHPLAHLRRGCCCIVCCCSCYGFCFFRCWMWIPWFLFPLPRCCYACLRTGCLRARSFLLLRIFIIHITLCGEMCQQRMRRSSLAISVMAVLSLHQRLHGTGEDTHVAHEHAACTCACTSILDALRMRVPFAATHVSMVENRLVCICSCCASMSLIR